MVDTPTPASLFLSAYKRPAKPVIAAMAQQNVFIGRIWPILPTCTRITIGTQEEMEKFQSAFQKVMRGTTAFSLPLAPRPHLNHRVLPS